MKERTQKSTPSLLNALKLSEQGMVCIFGGGGKTSLMFSMASLLAKRGSRVLTTTSTKIFYPTPEQSPKTLICGSAEELITTCRPLLKEFPHISAGTTHDRKTGKVKGFSPNALAAIQKAHVFDWIIVETDGAQRKPVKASADHEPVFPATGTHLVLVAGMDALGIPLDADHVHRPELFSKNTGHPMGSRLTVPVIANALGVEMKKARSLCQASFHHIFLNKADTYNDVENAKKMASVLVETVPTDGVLIGVLEPAPVLKHIYPFHKKFCRKW